MIALVGRFWADSDSKQYILKGQQWSTRKDPTTNERVPCIIYVDIGYYPTMEQVVRACTKRIMLEKTKSEDIKTLSDWLEEYREVNREIKKALEGAEGGATD